MTPLRRFVAATALFAALAALMTWPQVARLATDAADNQDVYFNMWRLGWFAHALRTSPGHLFDGNIFYPEPRTLTFSDAMPVEGLIAAPLLWSGVPPVLVHNLILLGGIVFSAAGMFVLARHLTGSAPAAVAAGIIFGFAPYRFDHYMHLELQWTVWIPWAMWALHRACETGERRFGLLTGAFVALQMLSSIYYGVFLATLLALSGVLLLWPGHVTIEHGSRPRFSDAATSLAAGALLAAVISGLYAIPYLETKQRVGGRPAEQIRMYSAEPGSYLAATPTNLLYGDRHTPTERPERRLFPGILAAALAAYGVFRRRRSFEALVYLGILAAAFEMSLGTNGFTYGLLHRNIGAYQGLRAPARLGIFVVFAIAILAAYGVSRLTPKRAWLRRGAAVLIPAVLLLEYWVAPLPLVPYPNAPTPLYTWLSRLPPGVLAEFPMPRIRTLPGQDVRYTYMSTFHWMPIVNGYSGYYPVSYFRRIEALASFPDDESIERLRREHVRYIVIHTARYAPAQARAIVDRLETDPRLAYVTHADDGEGDAIVFELRS